MANTPELRDHRIGHSSNDLYTAWRVARPHTANTPELRDHYILSLSMGYKHNFRQV
jgi:hypothetical protein